MADQAGPVQVRQCDHQDQQRDPVPVHRVRANHPRGPVLALRDLEVERLDRPGHRDLATVPAIAPTDQIVPVMDQAIDQTDRLDLVMVQATVRTAPAMEAAIVRTDQIVLVTDQAIAPTDRIDLAMEAAIDRTDQTDRVMDPEIVRTDQIVLAMILAIDQTGPTNRVTGIGPASLIIPITLAELVEAGIAPIGNMETTGTAIGMFKTTSITTGTSTQTPTILIAAHGIAGATTGTAIITGHTIAITHGTIRGTTEAGIRITETRQRPLESVLRLALPVHGCGAHRSINRDTTHTRIRTLPSRL